MVSRDPEEPTPPAKRTVTGYALHITSKKPGGEPTMLGLLVAPSPEKMQEMVDFLRSIQPMTIGKHLLTGAVVTLNAPES